MAKFKCITSLWFNSRHYMPGEVVNLPAAVVEKLPEGAVVAVTTAKKPKKEESE